MNSKLETWTGRLSVIFLALLVLYVPLTGCTYKHYIYSATPSVIKSYIGTDYYMIIYGKNAAYHLKSPEFKKDTLKGQLANLDSVFQPYLVSDTMNTNFRDLKHKYHPAEACHVKTNLLLEVTKLNSDVNIPLDSILNVHIYHWKMKKNAKIIVLCTVGVVFIGLIILAGANMDDMDIGGLSIGSK